MTQIRSILAADSESVMQQAAEVIRGGGIVVLPTETVYGAAGLLRDPAAQGSDCGHFAAATTPSRSRFIWPSRRMRFSISINSMITLDV